MRPRPPRGGTEIVQAYGLAGRCVSTQRPPLTSTESVSPSRKTRFSSQAIDLAVNFPLNPGSRTILRSSVLRIVFGSRAATTSHGVVPKLSKPFYQSLLRCRHFRM